MPVAADEGVYQIASPIQFFAEQKFEKLVLIMGNSHLIKVAMACIGEYLKHSGIENIFIEIGVFGRLVTEQILEGSSYAKSLAGFDLIYESMRRLQLQEFFTRGKAKEI
ncbi:hypothetical protein QAD02_008970 [Eretmocerus hayati]|uniref:Uncharacterized protein n=1 Tax=Eretmocerus hayati TaxID=131215 RepID=A0ACC2N994_9HYME|nr:hypothetical protein QAD02_008970 [Eretmocerus hayati]